MDLIWCALWSRTPVQLPAGWLPGDAAFSGIDERPQPVGDDDLWLPILAIMIQFLFRKVDQVGRIAVFARCLISYHDLHLASRGLPSWLVAEHPHDLLR